MPVDIKSCTLKELEPLLRGWDVPAYRLNQILHWLHARRVTAWDSMTNLPKSLREQLAGEFTLQSLELVRKQGSDDTTQKFLWQLADHSLIESVLIPANPTIYGERADRHTLCVSTQVGCAYGCKFCASGLDGWKRNLQPHEIVEQIHATERWATQRMSGSSNSNQEPDDSSLPQTRKPKAEHRTVDNLVIMGMGEPLANYDNLLKALEILNAPWGGGIGARKITISTSGLAPQIRKLAEEPFQFRLAISLHGATDDVRGQIMPVNRKFPLADLTAACEHYIRRKGKMITLEYILIAGVNDALAQAAPLAQLARRLHAKVNLIPYNRVDGLNWERPDENTQEAFLSALTQQEITATLRREKGHDIDAACGQLRLKTERELAEQPD